jgi:hypothetical protein
VRWLRLLAASVAVKACVMGVAAGSLSVLRLTMITRSQGGGAGAGGGGGVGSTLADSCVMSSGVLFAAAADVVAVPYAGDFMCF